MKMRCSIELLRIVRRLRGKDMFRFEIIFIRNPKHVWGKEGRWKKMGSWRILMKKLEKFFGQLKRIFLILLGSGNNH
jgi:hypothetical protein